MKREERIAEKMVVSLQQSLPARLQGSRGFRVQGFGVEGVRVEGLVIWGFGVQALKMKTKKDTQKPMPEDSDSV